jgi:hypothetical protein
MAHPLDDAFAKFDAAHKHFETLIAETRDFLGGEEKPYSESLELNERERYISVVTHIKRYPSLRFSTRVGDIVHNLASSLDNAMFALAELRAGREIEQTSFPMYGGIRDYRRFRARRNCWLRHLTTADRALIQRCQPYRGGDFAFYHPLAQLYRLWNRDKHRTLNVTFAMVAEYGYELTVVRDIASMGQPIFRLGAVEDGAEILRFPFVPSGPAPEVKLDTEVTLDIGVDNGLRIRYLLRDIGTAVEVILDHVSKAFPESPTYEEWAAAHFPTPE